ncbi:MAG TPA: hypothetical protein VKF40_01100 [Burkholderiales bacterium]|nr:hypothetical protein [Burkholderiales bacterium]
MTGKRVLCRASVCSFLALAFGTPVLAAGPPPVTPEKHRRGGDQTFLTFPEWYLVHSPAEYAAYVRDHAPSRFPFIGHICQFWQSYRAVYDATRNDYPFNGEYHTMIMVIGASTTVEYALRSTYETLIGRVTELTQTNGMTAEDRLGARVAQDYVDFIRVQPWYEYDFLGKLRELWLQTGWWGPDMLRKWERKYALTTEYGIKAIYGWLIMRATRASFEVPIPETAVLVDRLPEGVAKDLPELKVLERRSDGSVLITVPRYQAFSDYSSALAKRGVTFQEIAGNRSLIMVSALVPRNWQPADAATKILFTQPIITQPAIKRVALVVPVASLAAALVALGGPGMQLEHVYDY